MEDGEDAGGAIIKKLYCIHSRYVLETNENLNIDISGQRVEAKFKENSVVQTGRAIPLDM